jgi:hypothetical protein
MSRIAIIPKRLDFEFNFTPYGDEIAPLYFLVPVYGRNYMDQFSIHVILKNEFARRRRDFDAVLEAKS